MARKPRGAKSQGAKQGSAGGTRPQRGKLPGREEILEFLRTAPGKVGKREIARAFGIGGAERIDLKRLLAEMADDGTLAGNRKGLHKKGGLPPSPCSK